MKNLFFCFLSAAENSARLNDEFANAFLIKYALCIIIGYFSGGLLFAYFIPKVAKHVDVTELSDDKNPGTFNAFKYGGLWCGMAALSLEIFKGFAPVFAAAKFMPANTALFVPVALAPVLGHAFSPFFGLKKGGKCIAVSFGVLLGTHAHLIAAICLAAFLLFFSVIIIINPNSLRTAAAYVCCDLLLIFLADFWVFITFTAITAIVLSKLFNELEAIFKKQAPSSVRLLFIKKA